MPTITQSSAQIDNYPPSLGKALRTTQSEASAALQAIQLFDFQKTAADGTATTATAETLVGVVGAGGTLGAVKFVPGAALTASDTDYATITLQKRTAGGAPVTVASATTKTSGGGGTGSWTQWSPVAIPIAAGAVAAGDALSFVITKTGAGVVVPVGVLSGFLGA